MKIIFWICLEIYGSRLLTPELVIIVFPRKQVDGMVLKEV